MENHYPEILGQFLGQKRDGGAENFDLTTKQAADICGRCQSASEAAQGPEPLGREERSAFAEKVKPLEEIALGQFAIQHHLWISPADFLNKYHNRFIGAGAEQKVYLSENGFQVLKVTWGRFHPTWLEYFHRLLFHRFLFPATAYDTVGFTEDEGKFAVVTRQTFAILEEGASRENVEPYLHNHGFERFKNDDYYNKNIGVKLEDLHDENVFLDSAGNLLFIDPVIYFETPDLKLGGKHVFRFPFGK